MHNGVRNAPPSLATAVALSLVLGLSIVESPRAEDSLEDLLVEKGVISQEERDGLADSEEEEAPEESTPESSAEPTTEEDVLANVVIDANYKGLSIASKDGDFKFAFGGRLQLDGSVFDEDESKLGDGVEMRRARIKSFGTVGGDWDYKLEVNFDPDLDVPVTDGWIRYSGYKPFAITVGHQKVPFSQQSMTSSNWQVFQERALSDAFVDNEEQGRRRMGIVFSSYGDCWNSSGGAFSSGLDDSGTSDDDWGFATRQLFAPIAQKDRVVAVAGAVIYRNFTSDSDLRIRARPGSNIAGTRLVDTGKLTTARRNVMINAEGTFVWGPFHAQTEYVRSWIHRRRGDRNVVFDAWYVQAGVFLTGESRNFDLKSGKFKRPMPDSKWGAWELALRFDGIDLTDEDVRGGRQRDITAGVNWWTNRNIMFRVNYVYGHADPNSGVTLSDNDEKVHTFSARAQVVF